MPLADRPAHLPARLARLPSRQAGRFTVLLARGARSRLLGLAGLPPQPSGTALLLAGTRSVHTTGMRFALDLVWLDARGRVVQVDEAVPAGRLRSCRRARAVLECPTGDGRALASTLGAAWRP